MKKIPLTQGKFAIVDDEDYDWLMQWKWCAQKAGRTFYAVRSFRVAGKKIKVQMHRSILNVRKGLETDHINHNGLDNRKQNLRTCTRSQNGCNLSPRKGYTSRYKGVSWNKGRWQASIKYKGKTINFSRHDSEIDAAKAYDVKAKEIQREFACLNFKEKL